MKELSLFSGAGGGLLGTKLLGWEHCGYVEFNDYCQRVIAQRIDDGFLDEAPIFSDIKAFISEGYADAYQGMVDVVTGGFPCQPFSVAGKQAGADDSRNMWPETLAVLRIVQPRFAYLENVPGLLTHEYARRIFGDLAESGFDAQWRVLSAAECGAPHKRDRVWIVAYADRGRFSKSGKRRIQQPGRAETVSAGNATNTNGKRCGGRREKTGRQAGVQSARNSSREGVANASGARLEGRKLRVGVGAAHSSVSNTCWWETEPDVGRVADGVAARVDRLKALGNGQVPAVAATAWEALKVSGVK
jgi:DNA (cytosine-5)-methyltransferase 1